MLFIFIIAIYSVSGAKDETSKDKSQVPCTMFKLASFKVGDIEYLKCFDTQKVFLLICLAQF